MARVHFPSFDKLIAATVEVARALVVLPEGHPHQYTWKPVAIGGGLAMQFHGSPRLTADVDLVASGTGSLAWPERLTFGGRRGLASNGVPVDVIVREDEWEELYLEALGAAVAVDEAPIPVLSAAYLVAIKMVAGRPKDETDVLFLLQSEGFDVGAAEEIVRTHLGAFGLSEFRSLRKQAEWQREREK